MALYEGVNYDTEMVILPAIKNLHRTLLEEDIKLQLQNPFDSTVNCVKSFEEQVTEALKEEELDSDDIRTIKAELVSFYSSIIELISEKYQLECDTESLAGSKNIEELGDICEAMYSFFVLKLKKNIKNSLLNYILENRDEIATALDYLKKKKDVTTISLRKKIEDPDASMIVSNIVEVVGHIKSLDISMDKMIQYLDIDLYNNSIINDLMTDCVIRSDFQALYYAPLSGFQDCNYDDIIAKISNGVIKASKKGAKG